MHRLHGAALQNTESPPLTARACSLPSSPRSRRIQCVTQASFRITLLLYKARAHAFFSGHLLLRSRPCIVHTTVHRFFPVFSRVERMRQPPLYITIIICRVIRTRSSTLSLSLKSRHQRCAVQCRVPEYSSELTDRAIFLRKSFRGHRRHGHSTRHLHCHAPHRFPVQVHMSGLIKANTIAQTTPPLASTSSTKRWPNTFNSILLSSQLAS